MTIAELETSLGTGSYASREIALVRGSGAMVWDDTGKQYIDCTCGVGVANIGHCHPELVAAIQEQVGTIVTVASAFANDVRVRCMEKLISIAPAGLDRVFLCNSGTESVEAAIKFARQSTGRTKVVSALRGFHGRSLGALSATHRKEYQEPFAPLVPGFVAVPFNRRQAMEQAVDSDTAAVILELVQGEGGVRPAAAEYVSAVQRICHDSGALLVIDEIQTGFCRTGKMFACEHFELEPDILCLAKAIAGGLPMGAVLVNQKIRTVAGTHGSTFGGNPLASAACLAAIEVMERESLAPRAEQLGDDFVSRLREQELSQIRQIRHQGLMIGIELRQKVTPILMELQKNGILALPAGSTVLRLLPPLVITQAQLGHLLDAVVSVLGAQD
ncbi:MAG: acetylornithine/succinylornithine family transaminase [Acidiferrobacterales bacterium]|nr:acetylornithine/succinylornithine family transaminase [Acidiferrobacterales bacterium]